MSTIPASEIAQVSPSVLAAAGSTVDVIGLLLTTSARPPLGSVQSFPDAAAVAAYFGGSSLEAALAGIYFSGFDGAPRLPGSVLFAQYNTAAVAAYLRGGDVSAMTIAELQALSGSLTVIVDGYTHVISSINLAAYGSFSAAASAIGAAFTEPTEASFTASLGAAITGSMGGSFTTCTTNGTTLTIGGVGAGYLSAGDLVSGTDSTNSLPAGCSIVQQLTGAAGGAPGATFELSAAGAPGDLSSFTMASTSKVLDATVIADVISVGDTITGAGVPASTTVVSQLTGTAGGVGTYELSCEEQSIASESMVATSNRLQVTVCASATIAVGQTLAGTSVTGSPLITEQASGTAGGVGVYLISGSPQHVASEAMTGVATAPVVTYDSTAGAFVVTSGITGAPSSAAFATGTLSASLKLTAATGAVLSQGAAPASPAAFMDALVAVNRDWVTFMTTFDPDSGSGITVREAFAAWKDAQNERYAYVCWDTDVTPTNTLPATASLGYALANNGDSGTCLLEGDADAGWDATEGANLAAFVCGAAASIDFEQRNGRITFAFKAQAGLLGTVTDSTVANNLAGSPQSGGRGNGYNFYGVYGAANANFTWFQRGFVTGDFAWLDSYINQVWLNDRFQNAILTLFANARSIPYNAAGNALIEAALSDPIQSGLNFGAFAPGTISAAQIAQVNSAAGANIATTLQTQGWYLQILPASSAVRAARGSPPCTFWYLDRGSVQAISLASIAVQ